MRTRIVLGDFTRGHRINGPSRQGGLKSNRKGVSGKKGKVQEATRTHPETYNGREGFVKKKERTLKRKKKKKSKGTGKTIAGFGGKRQPVQGEEKNSKKEAQNSVLLGG